MKIIFFILVFFFQSCAYKPLYEKNNLLSNYKINLIIKSKERYNNDASLFKLSLKNNLNYRAKKSSNLKLVVSLEKQKINLGINKDLSTSSVALKYTINYSFYDKLGLLLSGNLSKQSSYNLSENAYGNMASNEDSSNKLIKSLSESLAYTIITSNFVRKISP